MSLKIICLSGQLLCRPKEFGGLSIINTHIFNECLMTK
jgi:hypothetical protein